MAPVLEMRGIRKAFPGVVALDGVSRFYSRLLRRRIPLAGRENSKSITARLSCKSCDDELNEISVMSVPPLDLRCCLTFNRHCMHRCLIILSCLLAGCATYQPPPISPEKNPWGFPCQKARGSSADQP